MDELRHECGIAALYHLANGQKSKIWSGDPDETTRLMPRMLQDLQNRGQLAAGMASYRPGRDKLLDTYKELGSVAEAFCLSREHKYASILEEYSGRAVIGHTRYATSGPTGRSYAQPFEQTHGCKWKWFAFAFNGNLANFETLRAEVLANKSHHLTRNNDTEIIQHLISRGIQQTEKPDLFELFKGVSEKLDGAYNLVFLNALGEMVVLRDPLGIRPLCYAKDDTLFAAASESVPLLNLGFDEDEIVSLEPGEMILIADGVVTKRRYAERRPPKHCFFEWVYFANVASVLDDKSVYLSRSKLGEELADQEKASGVVPLDDDTVVVPVPDTSKAAADAMAYRLGVKSTEGLIRNRYVGRTFIEAGNRADKVRQKFTPLRQVLRGKRIFLVEDSIVRGTTLKTLLGYLRDVGQVSEIHVRVACPPIVAPCFYGIDMAEVAELYAPQFMAGSEPTPEELDAMARDLGADSLRYLPLDALARCIDLPDTHLCRGCVTSEYPTDHGKRKYELELVPTGGCGRLDT